MGRLPTPAEYAKVYYDPSHPGGYGTARQLARWVKGATVSSAKKWLSSSGTYTLRRGARKRFPHDRIVVQGLDEQWSADLIDVQKLANQNGGFKYILTVIDALSKYAYAMPLKNKTAKTVAEALKKIFATSKKTPRRLRTDKGKEFMGGAVQELLARKGILYFTSSNYTKDAIVERFNRSLRNKLWKHFNATNNYDYRKVLPDVLKAYNTRKHSSTDMAPADVNALNAHLAWNKMYGDLLKLREKKKRKAKFSPGDRVRISKSKRLFEQGYKDMWTKEIFVIKRVIATDDPSIYRYQIEDLSGEIVEGSFLAPELQIVRPGPREIKKVVRRSKNGVWVTWRGFPNSLLTWMPRGSGSAAAVQDRL